MTPKQTALVLAELSDVYEKRITEPILRAYHAALGDLDFPLAMAAAERVIRTSEFFPRPAMLRKAAAVLADEAHESDASQAWAAALAAVRRYGRYQEPAALASLPDRTRRAVEAVGYLTLCNSTLIAAERKAFLSAYEAIKADALTALQAPAGKAQKQLSEGK